MSKGGRYAKKKVKKTKKLHGWKKVLLIVLLTILVLVAAAVIAGVVYWNSLLNMMGDADETLPSVPQQELQKTTAPASEATIEETAAPTVTTSPEDTWPEVVSNENITNIMLVGQNYREGEETKLSDTMILCSINRKTKTLTMMSIFRDLYVDFPPYKSLGWGRNRINVCYHLGSLETGTSQGGMEMLAQAVEYNFGIKIDHTVEIDFTAFKEIINALGGIEIELSEDEANYLNSDGKTNGTFEAGVNLLDGKSALAYARMRHSNGGDSDVKRTARQRNLISTILEECRGMGLLDLHKMATTVLPLITTDMTNSEITNYIFEFLPMLKDLEIVSMTLPVADALVEEAYPGSGKSWWYDQIEIAGVPSSVIKCNTWLNQKYLKESLGLIEEEE